MCHLRIIGLCENNLQYQILIGIKPIFSENIIQIDQVWPQLQILEAAIEIDRNSILIER